MTRWTATNSHQMSKISLFCLHQDSYSERRMARGDFERTRQNVVNYSSSEHSLRPACQLFYSLHRWSEKQAEGILHTDVRTASRSAGQIDPSCNTCFRAPAALMPFVEKCIHEILERPVLGV